MTRVLERVVVVGASAAGLSAADGLREGGFDGSITIVGAERHPPYDRPMVSKSLLTTKGTPKLHELRSPDRIAANRLDLRLGRRAVGLDVPLRNLHVDDGSALPWDALVIATGCRPRAIRTIEGNVLPVLHTPEDLQALREEAARYGEVSLIGAGFIGLEVAAGLAGHGVSVTVFDALPLPLEPIVGREIGARLRDLHVQHGVRFQSAVAVESVSGSPGQYEIRLANGAVHHTPAVLVGVGVAPDVDWLADSPVEVAGGVVSDAAGRTSVPSVWAAGDVAVSDHPLLGERVRVEHWTHAVEQGRHVGLNIARQEASPYSAVPYFWTEQFGRRFHCYGRRRADDESLVVEGSLHDEEYLVLFGYDDELHAVFSSGRVRSLRGYRKILERRGTWNDALALARANSLASAHSTPVG